MSRAPVMTLVIPVPETMDAWTLDEENKPETPLHAAIVHLLVEIFRAWIARTRSAAMTGHNIALRWDRVHRSRGVDPDVYLVDPAPPQGERATSLCTWERGHHAPRIAVEVVSKETAVKDYDDGPARYAASGTHELWVFDPLRAGPQAAGGPFVLQVWRRTTRGAFKRVHAGDGPAFSRELGAWLVVADDGMRLRIADDQKGERYWPTEAEAGRTALAQERAARAAAEKELARLRAEIAAQPRPARSRPRTKRR